MINSQFTSLFTFAILTCLNAADDMIIADFEADNYQNWQVTGEAFGPGPAKGALKAQMPVSGFQGRGLVNSYFGGDSAIGSLTSPEFKIERKYISFLIGGGKNPEKTAMNLLIDGKIVRNATGLNDKPGGSEALSSDYWDVTDLAGKSVKIQIIDNATGGWGHINVDQIIQTDNKPPGVLLNPSREIQITNRFLNFPIKTGSPKCVVRLMQNGRLIVRNDMELAINQAPDWWAPMDVSAFNGQSVAIEVDRLPEDAKTLTLIDQSDVIEGSQTLYREPLRGQLHFSPQRGWNNDPNGLVYFNGEYHLFFQHNPYGWAWGNMHWGHAVSRDLVHWSEIGDKLLPDEFGPMFSGSAVVDWQNTSGLGKPGKPPLVLFYTAAGDPTVQCMAWSLDGRNFTKYNSNPIIKQITPGNRDPKVIWHEPTKKWVMTLYVEQNKVHTIHFFISSDLKTWEKASIIDGFYECPDFFELPVDGNPANKKWVLTAANSEYMIGTFDGKNFRPETPKLPGHLGRGFYAAQTFSDIPSSDGRRIQIGWFQTATPCMPFNQSMTIPLELKLASTPEGPRLTWSAAKELDSLVSQRNALAPILLKPGKANPLAGYKAELARIDIDFVPGERAMLAMKLRGTDLNFESTREELKVNNHKAKAPLINGGQKLTIFVDRTGLEIFASGGLTYIPMPVNANPENLQFSLEAMGGPVKLNSIVFSELKPAWLNEGPANAIGVFQRHDCRGIEAGGD
ncbi:MAG: glycoside hydrolase family 32 protein, partial [bacterium]